MNQPITDPRPASGFDMFRMAERLSDAARDREAALWQSDHDVDNPAYLRARRTHERRFAALSRLSLAIDLGGAR